MKKYKFYVEGMHCKSCVILTESELNDLPNVEKATSDLNTCCVEVAGNFGEKSDKEIAEELSSVLQKHGYKLLVETPARQINWSDFRLALPIAAIFMVLFFWLQKAGIIDLAASDSIGYGTAFVIGIVASLSTCMAVVGGLVLSVSANYAKSGAKTISQVSFHVARLVTFFILGGAIGALGASFQLGIWGNFSLGIIVGLVMLIMGINLLEIWKPAILPTMPRFISGPILKLKNRQGNLIPALLGAATFFLPCGFTQAMQIYTLTAGGFMRGALTMFIFALGTLPVLALLSITSYKIGNGKGASVFFKTAGIIVLFFAVINILGSLAAVGIIPPIFN